MTLDEKKEKLSEILNSIEDASVRTFAEECINTMPDYFFTVPASSTGKYHPLFSLGDGGLLRHTCALVRFFNHLMRNDLFSKQFTDKEKDLLRVACMMHDSRKSGTQEEYEANKYTKFMHPMLAATVIREITTQNISDDDKELVANAVESHMGQWNVDPRDPNNVLPKPSNKYQKFVHLVDYLASRKDIDVKFDGFDSNDITRPTYDGSHSDETVETYTMPFGKHRGRLITEVAKTDREYLEWLNSKDDLREPLRKFLNEVLGIKKEG